MPPLLLLRSVTLQLWTGAHQRCACWGIRVFLEVLDKQFRQGGGFFLPLFRRRVGCLLYTSPSPRDS